MEFGWLIEWFVPQAWTIKALVGFSIISVGRMLAVFAIGYKLLAFAQAHKDNKLIYYPMAAFLFPFFYFGLMYDVFIQFTVATVIFLQFPRMDIPSFISHLKNKEWQEAVYSIEFTVTERMSRYLRNNDGWRAKQSVFWCKFLETFDPNHCGLQNSPYAALYNK